VAGLHAELVDLGRCADGLQAAIGAIVDAAATPLAADDQVRLQAADALTQRLDRLAALAAALEAQIPADWALDPATARAAAFALSRWRDAPETDGDCELF
jgi:hypothetical protein